MFQVQFISHFTDTISYIDSIRIALEGGCKWIQLRMKNTDDSTFEKTAVQAVRMSREYGATVILDDKVEMVRKVGADGVHLGLTDMPVAEARSILGSRYIIGGTANTVENIRLHAASSADYIGCGPLRHTSTKEKLAPTLGFEGYRHIISQIRSEGITLPVVGIGGVTLEDIPLLAEAGLDGLALSGSILRAENPVDAMRQVLKSADNIR